MKLLTPKVNSYWYDALMGKFKINKILLENNKFKYKWKPNDSSEIFKTCGSLYQIFMDHNCRWNPA